ncbi:MAG: C40 family peptidase [Bacteroidota bacterium]
MKSSIRLLSLSCVLLISLGSCGLFQPVSSSNSGSNSSRPRSVTPSSNLRSTVVVEAERLLGTRYKYGGNNPREGFDCSGLTVWAYQQVGLSLPRTSRTQATQGERIRESDARPGDLVYFKRNGTVFHVAVVIEAGRGELWVVHSTSSRGVIRENVMASSYWRPKIAGIRNVIGR